MTEKLLYKQESFFIQGGAFEIYKQFRNHHKEKIYQRALIEYLKEKGLAVDSERQFPIHFNAKKVGAYIPDIVVNDSIFIELKCKPFVSKEDIQQFWYYLKVTGYKLGYLINFGAPDGVQITRRVYETAQKI